MTENWDGRTHVGIVQRVNLSDEQRQAMAKEQSAGQVIRLRFGDSLSVLKTLPEASIGAVVTDPPY